MKEGKKVCVWERANVCMCEMHKFGLLTAKERIVTKKEVAAKNHCTLQMSFVSSKPASSTTTDVGIKILDTNKSANATLTIKLLPLKLPKIQYYLLILPAKIWCFISFNKNG